MTSPLRIACLAAALVGLAACGNKGPLVLAERPAPDAVETPAGDVPVELTPEAATGGDPATNPTTDALEDTATDAAGATPPVGADPAEPPTPVPARG